MHPLSPLIAQRVSQNFQPQSTLNDTPSTVLYYVLRTPVAKPSVHRAQQLVVLETRFATFGYPP